jgi:hypothetical protein
MPASRSAIATKLAWCALAPLAVLVLVYVPIWATGIETDQVTRDPVGIAELPAYSGALSLAGTMLWAVMVGACVVTALVLRRMARGRDDVAFFASSALLLSLLAIDDAYQLHENVLPYDAGIPQPVTYFDYAVVAVGWAWVFRDRLLRSDVVLLACAAALLAASVVVDELLASWLEDYFKFCGLCLLVVFWVAGASDALFATLRSPD